MFISPLNISPLASSASSFSPSDLSPLIWLDPSDETLGRMSTWTDKGSLGVNTTQATPALQPNVIADAVDFDDSSRYMDMNTTGSEFINSNNNVGGFELWTMLKMDSGQEAGFPCYFGARTSTNLYFQFFSLSSGKVRWDLGTQSDLPARASTNQVVFPGGQTGWTLVRLRHDSSNNQMEIFVNGVQMTLDATNDGDTTGIDFSNYSPAFNIHVMGRNNNGTHDSGSSGQVNGDMIIFNKLLTSQQALDLTNYFI